MNIAIKKRGGREGGKGREREREKEIYAYDIISEIISMAIKTLLFVYCL